MIGRASGQSAFHAPVTAAVWTARSREFIYNQQHSIYALFQHIGKSRRNMFWIQNRLKPNGESCKMLTIIHIPYSWTPRGGEAQRPLPVPGSCGWSDGGGRNWNGRNAGRWPRDGFPTFC